MRKIRRLLVVSIILIALTFYSFQYVFADRFWDLYQAGEVQKANGNLIGAIDNWEEIIKLYDGDQSKDALTRTAVYWTKIADAYNSMGWYGEAQIAYKNVEKFWTILGETDSAWGPNRIATRLKTDLRIYTKVPVQHGVSLAKHEPLSGAYFGGPFDKDPLVGDDLSKVAETYGKAHTAFSMYVRWDEPLQMWTANQAIDLGAALQIAWEPPADMRQIKYDEVLDFAQELNKLNIPIFLRFASEMNEISNPWSQNSPEVYKEVFQMVARVMHANAPNVALVWAPLYVPEDTISQYYPGDDAVDWVGVDAYTDRYYIGDPNTKPLIEDLYYQGYYANPLDRFNYIYETYAHKKPIFIAETGVQNYAMNTGEDFSAWAANNMRRLYGYLPMVYPKVKAIFYFNVDSNLVPGLNLKQNYSLSRTNTVMKTYKDLIQNSYYLSGVGETVNYQYKPLEETVVNKKNIQLSTYVKINDPVVSKVEYWLDGKRIGTVDTIPFESDLDLSNLSNGDHILRADAYNSSGELNARRLYKVMVSEKNVSFRAWDVQYIPKHRVLRDIDTHWAKQQIEKLVSLWSIDGYGDETFKPEKQITRAEFYKLLANSLGMGLETDTNSFTDISDEHWARRLINGGVQLGILVPSDYNNMLEADMPITRGELAMWTVRALNGGRDSIVKSTLFTDDGMIPTKYKGYVNDAYSYGVIDGFPDNTFRANETATRAQAVSVIIRALQYQNSSK